MDGDERPELADDATHGPRDIGYAAAGRLQDDHGHRARGVVLALVAVIGLGVVLSALTDNSNGLALLLGDASRTFTPSGTNDELDPAPTTIPPVGFLGFPLPERPIPISAGWLRWLDPKTGGFQGDAVPTDLADPTLTFAAANGAVVQVCSTFEPPGDFVVLNVAICAFNADGTQRARLSPLTLRADPLPLMTLEADLVAPVDGFVASSPIQLDATVSRDGRWLWVARSVHLAGAWHVSLDRVDLAELSVASSREIRVIPVGRSGLSHPSAEGWLVSVSATVRPVIRASPDGSRLSLTITETPVPGTAVGLLQQERLELDGSLSQTLPIDIVFPVGSASDLACDASRAAWATSRHFLTMCSHPEPNGDIQPFVRIENPDDMTRDVAVGPLIPAGDQTLDDSSWLLDVHRGVLYRWSYLHHTFTVLDVATRAGTTAKFESGGRRLTGADWPALDPADGLLAWSGLEGGRVPNSATLRLAGSADGTVLYAFGWVPITGTDGRSFLGSSVWVIDPRTTDLLGRWDAPGPIDQLALAPRGIPFKSAFTLIEFVTPKPAPGTGAAFAAWTTQIWFVDDRTGTPLEVLGEIRGPGYASPTLLPPAVASFPGF